MRRILYTIGYEGADIGAFLRTLDGCGIEQLLDIRDVPVSRKPGFSKSVLETKLRDCGIAYAHLKALGDPKPGREAMRRGDYPAFLDIYTEHLASDAAQEALGAAVAIAGERVSVLLCFERSPKECHRTIVAAEMAELGDFEIRNIGVNAAPASARSPGLHVGLEVLNL